MQNEATGADIALNLLSAVETATTPRDVVKHFNAVIAPMAGFTIVRLNFTAPFLREVFDRGLADPKDLAISRATEAGPVMLDGGMGAVAVRCRGRVVGHLVLQCCAELTGKTLVLAEAAARAVGEVAAKGVLRRRVAMGARERTARIEQGRIARELGDTAGQTLYGLTRNLLKILRAAPDPATARQLEHQVRDGAEAIRRVRSDVAALQRLSLRACGLRLAVRELIQEFEQATDAYASLRIHGDIDEFPQQTGDLAFGVVYELLTNVARHARSTGIVVMMTAEASALSIDVRDDGVDVAQRSVGDWRSSVDVGIWRIGRAVRAVGGSFTLAPALPRGLRVQAQIPRNLLATGSHEDDPHPERRLGSVGQESPPRQRTESGTGAHTKRSVRTTRRPVRGDRAMAVRSRVDPDLLAEASWPTLDPQERDRREEAR